MNAIEEFNYQLRKVTKSKTVFSSDESLLKMLYLAMIDITKKWKGHRQDWRQIYSQLEIFFEERLSARPLLIIQTKAEPQKIGSAQSN